MTGDTFQNLPLNESFERVAKVAEERAAFNAGVEAAAKPDPLVAAMVEVGLMPLVSDLRAALEARGFEIVRALATPQEQPSRPQSDDLPTP